MSFGNVDRGYLLELGTLSPGYEVKLTADEAGEQLNAIAYRFSEDAMIQVYDRLNRDADASDELEGHEAFRNCNC